MNFQYENHTYELVILPKGKKIFKNKWVYKIKHDENSPQPKYNARLVVKGFCQKKGIDFLMSFFPLLLKYVLLEPFWV